jgi:hypothetical protein
MGECVDTGGFRPGQVALGKIYGKGLGQFFLVPPPACASPVALPTNLIYLSAI